MRGSPGAERPRPSSVTAGTRRPRPLEYQPRIGSVSPRCRLHRRPRGSSSRAAPGVAAPGQRRIALAPSSSASHVGTEVEGEADVVAAAVDLVDDLDAARGPVQPDRATVPGRRVERRVAVVLGGPARRPRRCRGRQSPGRSRAAATGTGRRRWTGSGRRARRCCARSSSGSTTATRARRGSSRCPDRRGCRRRRSGPPRTGRRRGRARRC